ncbi:YozE family protein [Bacillus sp. V3]|nr:YozE family protein [Bacillus sp. V3]
MRKSFYHYLMKHRQPTAKDDITRFANEAYDDHSFPKQSWDYDEISLYLEMNGSYLESMIIFDRAWDLYLIEEKG